MRPRGVLSVRLATLCPRPRPNTLAEVFGAGYRIGVEEGVRLADQVARGEITLAEALDRLAGGSDE